MRTAIQVKGDSVLAVVLTDVASQLTFSIREVTEAAVKGGYAYNSIAKDFLVPNAPNTSLNRGINTIRRKCTTFILSKLPKHLQSSLLKG